MIGWGQRTDGQTMYVWVNGLGLDRMDTRAELADGLRTGVYIEM